MPTETDLLILAAELDRSDSEARAYALSHEARESECEYLRNWVRDAYTAALLAETIH